MSRSIPPNALDLNAERAVLGSIIRRPTSVDDLAHLKPGHFGIQEHGRLFESLAVRVATGYPAAQTDLEADFALSDGLAAIGGPDVIGHLALTPEPTDRPELERHLVDLWQRRQLIEVVSAAGAELQDVVLAARGGDRQSAEQLTRGTVDRLASWFGILKAVLDPLPEMLKGTPSDVSVFISLIPSEVRELASSHEAIAVLNDKDGQTGHAEARRFRAQQLLEVIGEAQQ